MAFVGRADGADKRGVTIAKQTNRVRVKRNMRALLLAVPRHALEQFFSFFRRLDADAEDLHFSFEIPFPLINKGRHLGPAPRSPATALEKNHVDGAAEKIAGNSTVALSIS